MNFNHIHRLPPLFPPRPPRYSTPRWLNGELTRQIRTSSPPPPSPSEEEEPPVQINASRKEEKRILDIDLNVSPIYDEGGSGPAAANTYGNERKISSISADAAGFIPNERYDPNVNLTEEFFYKRQKEIEARSPRNVANGYEAVTEKGKGKEIKISHSDEENYEEKERRNRRWKALVEVAQKEKELENQKKQGKTSRDAKLGGESQKGYSRMKIIAPRRPGVDEPLLISEGCAATTEVVAPPSNRVGTSQSMDLGGEFRGCTANKKIERTTRNNVEKEYNPDEGEIGEIPVARSSRGRAVAMPDKYRESVLDSFPVDEYLRRHSKRKL